MVWEYCYILPYLQLVCAQSVFVVAVVCVKWSPLVRRDLMSPVKHLAGYVGMEVVEEERIEIVVQVGNSSCVDRE